MNKTTLCMLAALVVGGLAVPAIQAGQVDATFNTVSPMMNVQFSVANLGITESTEAGLFNWTATSGGLSGNFKTCCIELNQYIGFGGNYQYNLVSLQDAGNPDTGLNLPGEHGPIGVVKASLLRELFGRDYNGGNLDASQAAALQMDVWEIVYDGNSSQPNHNLNLSAGNFTATSGDPATNALAQSWLDSLNGAGPKANLIGLTSPDVQDQVTIAPPGPDSSVPEPATVVLAGLAATGFAGWAWGRKRRLQDPVPTIR